MALSSRQRRWLQVGATVVLIVVVAPLLLAMRTFVEETPIVAGRPAPRTVTANDRVQVENEEATQRAREEAANSVSPVYTADNEARSEILGDVMRVFDAVAAVREPGQDGDASPPAARQVRRLQDEIGDVLAPSQIRAAVRLSDQELTELRETTVSTVRELARTDIRPGEVETALDRQLPSELALRSFPRDTATSVAEPLLRQVMQPTVIRDDEATRAAREERTSQVEEVVRTWEQNDTIVREGEVVDQVQVQALRQLGLEGSDAGTAFLRAAAAMLAILVVGALYLRQMQRRVWRSGRRLLLLGVLVAGYALLVTGVGLLAHGTSPGYWYTVPAGALGMLAAMLVDPVVGLAMILPGVVAAELVSPQSAGVPLFIAAAVLASVPLVTSLTSRSELRAAALRTGVIYPALALVSVLAFGPRDQWHVALLAGLANALVTAVIVQGLMPFLETWFQLPTVTALLDLADRTHPLLRELEQKALGSYNHSVMVASLVDRACREIGADPLLGTVAALYHDIGKVRQPYFFIENQRGIANPHDELEPEVSAIIIQNHVQDGVEMATEHRLPPEVVSCIRSHHGTMLVSYFYNKALERAGGDPDKIDTAHYRYKGTKPRSKEAGVLVMADCSEAATRSAAMDRGTLPREEIESMVDGLIEDRIDDGQFDRCDLTFDELSRVRDSIVEALVGIYHPRIAYPGQTEMEPRPPVPVGP